MADRNPLEAGPLRDVLGKLVAATRAGETLDTHTLSERTGVPYMEMRRRLTNLEAGGFVTHTLERGVTHYSATPAAEEVLG